MATRGIQAYEQSKDASRRSWQFLRSCYPRAILMRKPESKSPPRGPNPAALAGASAGPDCRGLTFPHIWDIKNRSTHSNIMKHITAFLLTVALLSFSIVTGRAEQPTELPSGNYYLSLTSSVAKDEVKNHPVRLTTKSKPDKSASSGDRKSILTDIVIEAGDLGNIVGQTAEEYDKGKLINGFIVLSVTTQWPRGHLNEIITLHLMGTVSNHSATGEGASFRDLLLPREHDSYRSEPIGLNGLSRLNPKTNSAMVLTAAARHSLRLSGAEKRRQFDVGLPSRTRVGRSWRR